MPAAITTPTGCRRFIKPSSPVIKTACIFPSSNRNNLKWCSKTSGISITRKMKCQSNNLLSAPVLLVSTSARALHPDQHSWLPREKTVSGSFSSGDEDTRSDRVYLPPLRKATSMIPKAFKEIPFSIKYPVILEKPEWWLRTLACVPYLIAIQTSDVGYYLQPFLEHYSSFEDLIFYVPGAVKRLPIWFHMIYCLLGYKQLVKNKNLPHFFRFHLMMGMLLETALQILWYSVNFVPIIHYGAGKLSMHLWAGIGIAYIIILLRCVKSAICGAYADIPFVSNAAYIHTLFNIGDVKWHF